MYRRVQPFLTGELGVSPSLIFFPFPKRKGTKGMAGTPIKSFEELAKDFLYKAIPLVKRHFMRLWTNVFRPDELSVIPLRVCFQVCPQLFVPLVLLRVFRIA